jgi:hypothetical protein
MREMVCSLLPVLAILAPACSPGSSTGGNNLATHTDNDGSVDSTIVFLDAGPSTPVAPDGAIACPAGCNYQTQQGCASGQMCHPQLSGGGVSPQCQAAGSKASGESCVWGECQSGLICFSDGRCRRMCCGGDWSVCANNETCTGVILLQGADAGTPMPTGVSVCSPVDACDVLDPESCPAGKSCYIVDSRGDVQCIKTGTVPFNGACSATELCAAGLTCVASGDGRTSNCRRLCRAVVGGGEPGCPAAEGGYCAHFVRDPPGVGECTPAM